MELELIHYTDCRNIERIRETGMLRCALSLMNAAEKKCHASKNRPESLEIGSAVLRDQQALTKRIVFCDGASFEDYVYYLNQHVFFWPSSAKGEKARTSFRKKYAHPKHIGLRCNLSDLEQANSSVVVLFSPYNSGATPRIPKKSPRSLDLFQPLAKRGSKSLVEIVVRGEVRLPDNTEIECENGWRSFFHDRVATEYPTPTP